jgi:membrane fusion protein, multidrug efflux system
MHLPPPCKPPVERARPVVRAALAALAGALLAAGCSRSGNAAAAAAPSVPVQVGQVVRRTLPRRQFAIGTVQTLRSVTVKSQVDGVIDSIHFREGDDVRAGDLLVALDRRPFENALRIARADLVNAEAQAKNAQVEADRYQQLDQQQAISKEQLAQLLTDVETTRAQVQSKQAAVANAELQLGYSEIRAPIGGRTGQLLLHEGSLVKANDNGFPLVTINQLAPIAVAYAVPESILTELRAARAAGPVAVQAITHETPPQTATGQLEFVDNAVDPTTGMILLKADFANTDHALWPGESVDVETLLGADQNALLVPAAAVQTGQNGSQVYVVKPDHTVALRPVTVGRSADGLTIIRQGLTAGETVVTDGQLRLVPGARVEVTSLEANAGGGRAASSPAAD